MISAQVQENGYLLKYALAFQGDKEIAMKAISQNVMATQFASDILKRDRDFIRTAVQKFGCALEFADPVLKNDFAFVLSLVQLKGTVLEFCDLRDDPDIVRAAITNDPLALQFALILQCLIFFTP